MNGIRNLRDLPHKIALLIQYDGSKFNGWQVQNKGRTVQGEIENAIEILSKERIRVTASGRTDAGVHAFGQVAHFDIPNIEKSEALRSLCVSLNGIIKTDISIKNAYLVPPDFHARYSAIQREYLYFIYNHPQKSPFIENRALWVRDRLDIDYFRETAQYLTGENDFVSFCKKISSDGNTIRKIDAIEITREHEKILFRIKGNAFLHNMIRIIIGTIIDMYKDNKTPDYIKEILEKRDRDYSGKTAPPYGLYLNKITYNPPLFEMESAYEDSDRII